MVHVYVARILARLSPLVPLRTGTFGVPTMVLECPGNVRYTRFREDVGRAFTTSLYLT